MAEIPFTRVVSVTSADPRHPAENLLRPEDGGRWRGATAGEKQLSVVLELGDSRPIHSLHIGNNGAAFVEVLLGCSAGGEFQVLLPTSALMSPSESRAWAGPSRVRLFGPQALVQRPATPTARYDRLQVVLSQPYCQSRPYGLAFVRAFAAPEEGQEPPPAPVRRLGPFTLREEGEGSPRRPPGSLFYRRPAPCTGPAQPPPGPSYAAAALQESNRDSSQPPKRRLPSPTSTSNGTPPKKPKNPQNTPKKSPKNTEKNSGTSQKNSGTSQKNLGFFQKNSGTSQNNFGASQKNFGTSQKNSGTAQNNSEPPQKNFGTPQKNSETTQKNFGTSQKNSGSPQKNSEISQKNSEISQKNFGTSQKNSENSSKNSGPPQKNFGTSQKNSENSSKNSGNAQENSGPPQKNFGTSQKNSGSSQKNSEIFQKNFGTSQKNSGPSQKSPDLGAGPILGGVVLALSGFQNPLRGHLRAAATAMGAEYRPDWTPECTHLVCAFPRTPKAARARQQGGAVVGARWIWECQKWGRRLSCGPYLLDGSASSGSEGEEPEEAPPPPRPSPKGKKGAGPPQMDKAETPPPATPATPPESGDSDVQSEDTDPFGGSTEPNTEDEEEEEEEEELPIPPLPDFLAAMTFFLHGEFPEAERRRLRRVVVAFGGSLAPYMDESVTHVVTSQDWDPAFEEALELRPSLVFVRPHWLLLCGERQRPIPAQPFLVTSSAGQ